MWDFGRPCLLVYIIAGPRSTVHPGFNRGRGQPDDGPVVVHDPRWRSCPTHARSGGTSATSPRWPTSGTALHRRLPHSCWLLGGVARIASSRSLCWAGGAGCSTGSLPVPARPALPLLAAPRTIPRSSTWTGSGSTSTTPPIRARAVRGKLERLARWFPVNYLGDRGPRPLPFLFGYTYE